MNLASGVCHISHTWVRSDFLRTPLKPRAQLYRFSLPGFVADPSLAPVL
jgi:hypothetical protein